MKDKDYISRLETIINQMLQPLKDISFNLVIESMTGKKVLSFEIYVAGESGNKHIYKCKHYKILSIESLSLDIKYEFNSDNKRMYTGKDGTIILAEGKIE